MEAKIASEPSLLPRELATIDPLTRSLELVGAGAARGALPPPHAMAPEHPWGLVLAAAKPAWALQGAQGELAALSPFSQLGL